MSRCRTTIITRFVNSVAADSDDTLITGQVVFNCQSACIAVATLSTITPTAEGSAPFRDDASGNGINQVTFTALRIFFGTTTMLILGSVSSKLIKKLDSPWFIILNGNVPLLAKEAFRKYFRPRMTSSACSIRIR